MWICPTERVLPVWCPQRSSGGIKGHLWALSMCFCALDMWVCPTEKVLQQTLVRKKVLCLMFVSPKMFCQYFAHKGRQEFSKDSCGHFPCVSVPWTCEFVPQKKFSNQHLSGKKFSASCLGLQGCFASCMPKKVLRRSQRTLVGTFNVILCLWHAIGPTKKFSNQHLSGKKFSASWLGLQDCFVSFMPTKVLRRSQRTLVGTINVFLCIGHVKMSHR